MNQEKFPNQNFKFADEKYIPQLENFKPDHQESFYIDPKIIKFGVEKQKITPLDNLQKLDYETIRTDKTQQLVGEMVTMAVLEPRVMQMYGTEHAKTVALMEPQDRLNFMIGLHIDYLDSQLDTNLGIFRSRVAKVFAAADEQFDQLQARIDANFDAIEAQRQLS